MFFQNSAEKDVIRMTDKATYFAEEARVVSQFQIHGTMKLIRRIGNGYINGTFLVECCDEQDTRYRYTLQHINTSVFPNVDALMDNYIKVTEHLHGKFLLEGHREKGSVPSIVLTLDGKPYYRCPSGCWRMVTYFGHVYSMDIPDSPETFYQCGRSFGKFIKDMSDMPLSALHTVIQGFHDTRRRYADLEHAICEDAAERVHEVLPEIEFIRIRRGKMSLIADALASGQIPLRITHNDTNLNNILFDKDSHKPVAVIDLDTVMPSSPLYDFGDSMRIGTNTVCDDERDLEKVHCNLNLYERYARGWLEECGSLLSGKELDLLPFAAETITLEDGIRFLTDYLNGDVYYKIMRQKHNLDRARTQLKLMEDMERKFPDICTILSGIRSDLNL